MEGFWIVMSLAVLVFILSYILHRTEGKPLSPIVVYKPLNSEDEWEDFRRQRVASLLEVYSTQDPGLHTFLFEVAVKFGAGMTVGEAFQKCAADLGEGAIVHLLKLLKVTDLEEVACDALAICGDISTVPALLALQGRQPQRAARRAVAVIQARVGVQSGGLALAVSESDGAMAIAAEAEGELAVH